MADKMLIDSTHPEETRVVVVRGNRVEEFDFESANRKQLRGNIYLAKVTRVEPSLQAAFVDYGGNRHGFLAFSEIHPDYYQIPVADRLALIAQEERDQRAADSEADHRASRRGGGRHRRRGSERHRGRDTVKSEPVAGEDQARQEFASEAAEIPAGEAAEGQPTPNQIAETAYAAPEGEPAPTAFVADEPAPEATETPASEATPAAAPEAEGGEDHAETGDHLAADAQALSDDEHADDRHDDDEDEDHDESEEGHERFAIGSDSASANDRDEPNGQNGNGHANGNGEDHDDHHDDHHDEEVVESVGGADALEEVQERVPRFRRQYKIQEVIKRRQVMLVQVVKEERGTKGAALTTYLSLAGRYSVLMPNTARGGGISRKITSSEDRSRLKEIAQDLEVPEGMGVILRTAGAARTKTEVKRDFEYLLRLWETVRDLTLKSMAPKLTYEEGSLVKRSIRDLYSKDIDEIIVAGEEGYKEARDFMRMLMPSHAKNVKLYKDPQPLFTRYGVESQLDAMFSPVVQLKSGGYIVINQAEALVAIDVNSGRATREHHIEDTALKTNVEAAEEVARQLRLRDLAGLIVIDFIDMDETRNNRTVERRLKEALKHDRARIQVGRISHFGLLEMSRQRIRSSVLENSTEKCPMCGGSGHVRSVSSVSLQGLRAIEEMLVKGATHNLILRTRAEVALYMLNHKRAHLRALEERFRIAITISADATVTGQVSYIVDRGEQVHTAEAAKLIAASQPLPVSVVEDDEPEFFDEGDRVEETAEPEMAATADIETIEPREEEAEREGGDGEREEGGPRRRRRRGRGRGRGGEPREAREGAPAFTNDTVPEHAVAHEDHDAGSPEEAGGAEGEDLAEARPRVEGEAAGANGQGGEAGEDAEGRRRRRRGRRGGRRNRHRNGDAPFAPGNGNGAEPHAQHLGADFPPISDEDASAFAPPFDETVIVSAPEEHPAPPPVYEARPVTPVEAPPAVATQEPPRRRSTIREPAPIAIEGAAPPPTPIITPPTPVISSTAPEETGAPKRGWWGKRLLGGKD